MKLLELVHEPLLGAEVEVVGRLVEDHDLGLLEQHPDEIEAAALTTREIGDVLEEEVLAQAEPVGQPGDHALHLVAAVLPELLLEIREPFDGVGRRILGHGLPGPGEPVVEDVETAGGEHVGEAGGVEAETLWCRDLGEEADRAPGPGVAAHPDARARVHRGRRTRESTCRCRCGRRDRPSRPCRR